MNCIISVGETLYLRMFCARYPAHAPFDPLAESRRGIEELSRLGKRADDETVMGIIGAMELPTGSWRGPATPMRSPSSASKSGRRP